MPRSGEKFCVPMRYFGFENVNLEDLGGQFGGGPKDTLRAFGGGAMAPWPPPGSAPGVATVSNLVGTDSGKSPSPPGGTLSGGPPNLPLI